MKMLSHATVFEIIRALSQRRKELKDHATYWDEQAKNPVAGFDGDSIASSQDACRRWIEGNASAIKAVSEYAPQAEIQQYFPELAEVFTETQAPAQGQPQ